MKILNKKETVFDIQLTQFGKELLARGEFNPAFYSFDDGDILYDAEYGGIVEPQNNASSRIKETPHLAVQSSYAGIETEINKLYSVIRQNEITDDGIARFLAKNDLQFVSDKHYSSLFPVGTMKIDAENKPAWNIRFYKGEINDVNPTKIGTHPSVPIPQINLKDVEIFTEIDKQPFSERFLNEVESLSDLEMIQKMFEDGSFVKIFENGVFVEINEENADFSNENFEIEVYEMTDDADGNELLVPLFFQQRKPQMVNDILLDDDEQDLSLPPLDPSFVQYFFKIEVDREIDPETICDLNIKDHPDEFLMQQIVICKELEKQKKQKDLYATDVVLEDTEKCE